MTKNKYIVPVIVFFIVFTLLSFVIIKVPTPMLLAERFIPGAGWAEILLAALYGSFVAYKMQDPLKGPKWRRITWTIFSFVFFSQLIIGISGAEKFLMTGKLHLPVPMMIVAGPVYRGELSVMTILFISTIILTGPAWCSQLCYFGAFDNLVSGKKTGRNILRHKAAIKSTVFLLVIAAAIMLRWLKVPVLITTIIAGAFGIAGILIMILVSGKRGKMVHCVMFCPIGSIVNILKHVNPFRMYIDSSCTLCMGCTRYCKYDALNADDIHRSRPGLTCTLCGDCLAGCHTSSIKYKFAGLSSEKARNLYLILTISLHATFLVLARI
ncbi:MAG TPA: 4Fe-4S binding protein [Bacteroidales bacterium]|nr:4Fe-4S binding protein [Bacteroidales bacterium]